MANFLSKVTIDGVRAYIKDSALTDSVNTLSNRLTDSVETLTALIDENANSYIDVTKYGVGPENADNAPALNEIFNTYGGVRGIYIPQGTYRVADTVIIDKNGTQLLCNGTIEIDSATKPALNIVASDCDIFVRRVNNATGDAVQVGSAQMTESIGNCTIMIPHIYARNIALHYLCGSDTVACGIQNINFYGNRLDYFGIGICLEMAGEIAGCWINENKFYSFWATYAGVRYAGGIGIQTIHNSVSTSTFNGNRFIDFSPENNKQAIKLSRTAGCNFENMRLIEQVGQGVQIELDSGCYRNHFSCNNGILALDQFADAGISNIYNMYVSYEGNTICREFTFRQSGFLILDGYMQPTVLESSASDAALLRNKRPLAVVLKGTTNYTITLPLSYSWYESAQPIAFITDPAMTGTVRVVRYNGTLLCNITAGQAWIIYCSQTIAFAVQVR